MAPARPTPTAERLLGRRVRQAGCWAWPAAARNWGPRARAPAKLLHLARVKFASHCARSPQPLGARVRTRAPPLRRPIFGARPHSRKFTATTDGNSIHSARRLALPHPAGLIRALGSALAASNCSAAATPPRVARSANQEARQAPICPRTARPAAPIELHAHQADTMEEAPPARDNAPKPIADQEQHLSDKSLQELRALALEYVKQIVAKSIELSQTHKNVCGPPPPTPAALPPTDKDKSLAARTHQLTDPTTRILIRDVAVQIDKRFRLHDNFDANTNANSHSKTTNFVRINQFRPRLLEITTTTATTTTPTTTTTTRDYAERDYVTVNNARGQQYNEPTIKETLGAGNQCNSSGASARPRRRLKGLHQRLNWHLLVSCFSTCLPETLVETANRQANKTSPSAV